MFFRSARNSARRRFVADPQRVAERLLRGVDERLFAGCRLRTRFDKNGDQQHDRQGAEPKPLSDQTHRALYRRRHSHSCAPIMDVP
jgi:hypothetical protein